MLNKQRNKQMEPTGNNGTTNEKQKKTETNKPQKTQTLKKHSETNKGKRETNNGKHIQNKTGETLKHM